MAVLVTLVSDAGVKVRVPEGRVAALKRAGFRGVPGRPARKPRKKTEK